MKIGDVVRVKRTNGLGIVIEMNADLVLVSLDAPPGHERASAWLKIGEVVAS